MSVTDILPAFCVLGLCVCACVRALVHVRVCVSLCLCMSEHFSGVEAAFMSVPSVENGSVSEGQPRAALGFPLCSEEPNAFI